MAMELVSSSAISNAYMTIGRKRTNPEEASVSSITDFWDQQSKRLSHGSKYKGVVEQKNGNWGAQIYANHNRVWLGTFNTETEAAMAYDSAAIKLRNGECQRNFPWTEETKLEPCFQNLYSEEDILNMIKEGSYQARLAEFLNSARVVHRSKRDILHKQLFQKELTPSDVGKLNRLVIPKNYAIKYFPRLDESEQIESDEKRAPAEQLLFYDENMRLWRFRFCYWKSSQSFVLTKGWSRFVKDRKLKTNDTIRFYECHIREEGGEAKGYMIKIDRAENSDVSVENASRSGSLALSHLHAKKFGEEKDDVNDQIAEVIDEIPPVDAENKSIRLFGVWMA